MLKLAITAFALLVVFKKIDGNELWQLLKSCQLIYLSLAIVFFVLSKILSSLRLNQFLKDIGIGISEQLNLKLYWVGMYYNLFLPGGIGGDGYKIYLINKFTKVNAKTVFWAVLFDRLTGLIALFSLAALLAYTLPYPQKYIVILWILVPMVLLFFYFVIKRWFSDFRGSFLVTNIQSFGVQLAQLISAFFILKSLHVDEQFIDYLFVFLISSIVATVPFTIGGVGAREITFIFASEILKLELAPAVGLSFLFFFITALVSLYGVRYSFSVEKLFSASVEAGGLAE